MIDIGLNEVDWWKGKQRSILYVEIELFYERHALEILETCTWIAYVSSSG